MTTFPKNETPRERVPDKEHWSPEIIDTAKNSLTEAKEKFPDFRAQVKQLAYDKDVPGEPERHLVANSTLEKLDKLLMSDA